MLNNPRTTELFHRSSQYQASQGFNHALEAKPSNIFSKLNTLSRASSAGVVNSVETDRAHSTPQSDLFGVGSSDKPSNLSAISYRSDRINTNSRFVWSTSSISSTTLAGKIRLKKSKEGTLVNTDSLHPKYSGVYSDTFKLSRIRPGQDVKITLTSASFDTYLEIIDAKTGRVVKANDDISTTDVNSEVVFTARVGTSYLARVSSTAAGAVGTYTLSSNLEGPEVVETSIGLNQTINNSLAASDGFNPLRTNAYADDYRLTNLRAGQSVQLKLNSNSFDGYLQLLDARTDQVLAFDDDGGDFGHDSQLTFTVQSGVDYKVRVTSFSAKETGNYTLITGNGSSPSPGPSPGPSPTPNPPGPPFSSTSGYGLVNAAAAVARAVGQSTFSDVANIGGNDWGKDLINAPEVWSQGYTGRDVVVAVIDTGVDINHPDLRNNLWRNSDEIAGNGVDDDRNGYIDDVNGWNFGFGQNNGNVTPGSTAWAQNHGTHVAGIIAGARDGYGVTGVAPDAKIMSLRLGNVDSSGRFTNGGNIAQAIRYAVDNGASVINMSIDWADSAQMRDALAYAASRNVITVSAAGNAGRRSPDTPAAYATDYGLSIGAVDRNGFRANFSNYAGSNSRIQHVMGPGVDIYSTLPNGNYGNQSGTSMATPFVSGVVALMKGANFTLTHDQIRQILTSTGTAVA